MPAEKKYFDTAMLAGAIDARRRSRGLTWAQVASETHVATSTARPKSGADMEVDGVMWLLQWLGIPFAAFVQDPKLEPTNDVPRFAAPLDGLPAGAPRWTSYRRFDTAALFDALDSKRGTGDMSWMDVAAEVDSPSVLANTLRSFAKGGRTTLSRLVPVLSWLGVEAEEFLLLPASARGGSSGR
jgi:transcriptional regulator with XRE-family HTH domain